jgi:PKD repeat protein
MVGSYMNKMRKGYKFTLIFLSSAIFLYGAMKVVELSSLTASTTTISVDPSTINAEIGQTFMINIKISDVIDLYGWEFKLRWNSSLLDAHNITEGAFLKGDGNTFFVSKINNTLGYMLVDCTLVGDVLGVSGNGILATVNFYAKQFGECLLDLYDTKLVNSLEQAITHTATDGTVKIIKGPIAYFTYTPQTPYVNESIIFNASLSTPDGGNMTQYEWDFGDGNVTAVTNPVVTHSYNTVGDYNVTLTVTDSEGLSNIVWSIVSVSSPEHNIAVINVTLSKTVASSGIVYVNVTVENQGSFTENFNITVYANYTLVAFKNVILLSRDLAKVTVEWNITGLMKGDYLMIANVTQLVGEVNVTDNVYVDGILKVAILGDINGDGVVDILDIAMVARAYCSYPGHPRWNPNADLDNNNFIDILDIAKTARNYGKRDC